MPHERFEMPSGTESVYTAAGDPPSGNNQPGAAVEIVTDPRLDDYLPDPTPPREQPRTVKP